LHLTQDIRELMPKQGARGGKGAAQGIDGSVRTIVAQSKDGPHPFKHPCIFIEEHPTMVG